MGCLRECTSGVMQFILFVFNLIILICAVLLISLGAIVQKNNAGYDLSYITIFSIALGVFIGLIAFFGCCGACKGNTCMLTTYGSILLTLFIIQVILGVIIFVQIKNADNKLDKESLSSALAKHLENLYQNYNTNRDDSTIVDAMQQAYQCCGINGPTDQDVNIGNNQLIKTCCSDYKNKDDFTCPADGQHVFHDGCLNKVEMFIEKVLKAAGAIALGFGAIELLAALFAFYVRNTYRNKRHQTY